MTTKKKPTKKRVLAKIDFCQRIRDQIAFVEEQIDVIRSIRPSQRDAATNARLKALTELLRALKVALTRCVAVPAGPRTAN